jgi:hypothetical protein
MIRFDSTQNIQCKCQTHDDATCLEVPEDHPWNELPPEGYYFEYPGVGQLPVLTPLPTEEP